MSYGAHNALADTVSDLRNHQPLIDLLESTDAIDEGWPRDKQEHPVVVRIMPITETSEHHHNSVTRTFRLQVSVVATDSWRSNRSAPTYRMAEIMHEVAQRLDIGLEPENLLPEGTASSSWEEVSGDRLASIQDWQVTRISS